MSYLEEVKEKNSSAASSEDQETYFLYPKNGPRRIDWLSKNQNPYPYRKANSKLGLIKYP